MRAREALRTCALMFSAIALVACATPVVYGPMAENNGYGYSDLRNADGSHTIRVVATNAQQAHEFWDRRAAEICGGTSYRKNIFRAHIPVVTQHGYATGPNGYGGSYAQDVYGALVMEGYLHCQPTSAAEAQSAPPPQQ